LNGKQVSLKSCIFAASILLALTLASMHAPRSRAEYITPTTAIPGSTYIKVDGSITSLDISYDGSRIAIASDAGYVYLVGCDGRILWKTPMRSSVSHVKGSLNIEWIVAVSRAMELSVYSYNGSLVDYRRSCSRAPARSLLYLYNTSTVVLLDELGWIYSYAVGEPEGRGEEWILGYSYTAKNYSVSIGRYDPTVFTELYPSTSAYGLTGEAAIAVYARISDNRTGAPSMYEAPLLRFYRFTGMVMENLFQLVLDDMRGYRLDSLEIYDTGSSKLILAAGSNPANPDPKARYLIRLYEVNGYKLGALYTARSSWSYSLGGRCIALRIDSSGSYIALASEDYQLYLFRRSTGSVDYAWSVSLGYTPSCIALESTPLTIAVGTVDGWIYMLDGSGDLLWRAPVSASTVTYIDLSKLSYRLAAGFSDGGLTIISDARLKRRILDVSLIDPTGAPISGANLTVAGMGLEAYTVTPIKLLLPVGSYAVVLDHIDIGMVHIDVGLTSDLELEVDSRILAQPMYPLTLNVYDERSLDVKPESYTVEISGRLGLNMTATLTQLNSTLTLPRDTYNVRIYADHYRPYNATVRLVSGVNLTAPLKPETYSLALKVYSWLEGFIGQARVEAWWMDRLYGYTYTSARGEATLTLPYGDYTVNIQADRYTPRTIPLHLAGSIALDVPLEPIQYTVRISVTGSDGTPISGSVQIYRAGKLYREEVFVGGVYTGILPYGSYRFDFSSRGWRKASADLSIPEKLSADIVMNPETYTLTLTVVDDLDKPLDGARITLSGPISLSSYTDSYGVFRVEAIRGGYTITVSMDGYRSTTTYVDLYESRQMLVRLQPELTTIIWRYLPYIVLLAVAPVGSLIAILLYLRRRRRMELEEISEEELEAGS